MTKDEIKQRLSNSEYWANRELQIQLGAERIGRATNIDIVKLYDATLKDINREINDIYLKFSNKTGLAVDELTALMRPSERTLWTVKINQAMKSVGMNVSDVYSRDFINSMSRITGIRQDLYWEIMKLAEPSADYMKNMVDKTIQYTYNNSRMDGMLENKDTFGQLNKEVLASIKGDKWTDKSYSDRIWGNTTNMAERISLRVSSGLLTGQSYNKTANLLVKEFNVSKSQATRLVRTENNHFYNKTHSQANIDDGFTKYKFVAILDGRTSKICQSLHNKIFKYSEMQEGVNHPTMHPNCRSSTKAILSSLK